MKGDALREMARRAGPLQSSVLAVSQAFAPKQSVKRNGYPFGTPCPCGFFGNSYARHRCNMKELILKNAAFDLPNTISIRESDPQWEQAHANWVNGKKPTDDPRWKTGVFLGSIDKVKPSNECLNDPCQMCIDYDAIPKKDQNDDTIPWWSYALSVFIVALYVAAIVWVHYLR